MDTAYNHPKYKVVISNLKEHLRIIEFGDVIESISGGATPLRANEDQYADSGIKFLRIQNITSFGFDFSDVKYITEAVHDNLLKRSQLAENDLLMTITGRIGTSAVVTSSCLPANINQHIVRIRLKQGVYPHFVAAYLNSFTGLLLSNRSVTGTTRLALDYESIKKIPFPDLSDEKQKIFANTVFTARDKKAKKLRQAEELLLGMSGYIHSILKIEELSFAKPIVYSVAGHATLGTRIDPEYHNPYYTHRVEEIEKLTYDTLGNIIEFSTEAWDQKAIFEEIFPYIEIAGVQIRENSYKATDISVAEAPSRAKMIVRNGDIIVSTTRPHRGAIATISCDETEVQIASTGFCVLRELKRKDVLKEYLQWILLDDYILLQMLQRSSGGNYPAITSNELKKIVIPIPDISVQQEICDEAVRRKHEADKLRREAKQEWQEAKEQFEKELLEG